MWSCVPKKGVWMQLWSISIQYCIFIRHLCRHCTFSAHQLTSTGSNIILHQSAVPSALEALASDLESCFGLGISHKVRRSRSHPVRSSRPICFLITSKCWKTARPYSARDLVEMKTVSKYMGAISKIVPHVMPAAAGILSLQVPSASKAGLDGNFSRSRVRRVAISCLTSFLPLSERPKLASVGSIFFGSLIFSKVTFFFFSISFLCFLFFLSLSFFCSFFSSLVPLLAARLALWKMRALLVFFLFSPVASGARKLHCHPSAVFSHVSFQAAIDSGDNSNLKVSICSWAGSLPQETRGQKRSTKCTQLQRRSKKYKRRGKFQEMQSASRNIKPVQKDSKIIKTRKTLWNQVDVDLKRCSNCFANTPKRALLKNKYIDRWWPM